MPAFRAQVILKTVDATPENYVTNTFAFESSNVSAVIADTTTAIKDFYDDIVGLLSPVLATNGHEIKYTALPGTPPNYPFEVDTFNLAANPTGDPMPSEVAICISFQGIKQAGFPQSRRRGRIYIGPLDNVPCNDNGRPSATARTTLANAATTFGATIDGFTTPTTWCVWSPSDGAAVTLSDGWIDNSFDTQRRRGVDSTSRTTFLIA